MSACSPDRSALSADEDWPLAPLPSTTRRKFQFLGTTWFARAFSFLVIQLVTRHFLTMNYKPDATQAFASVEYIMREVPWVWWIRYMHRRRLVLFHLRVPAHVPRDALRLIPQAARASCGISGC